jgi:hypothetical protein
MGRTKTKEGWSQAQRQGSNNKSWSKSIERLVAGLFGNRKWRVKDGAGKTADIIIPGKMVVEVKATRGPGPAWLQEAARQRLEGMEQEGLPGYIVFSCIDKSTGRRVQWVIEPLEEKWLVEKGLANAIQASGSEVRSASPEGELRR